MTFKFCELSAAIGYATCYYENYIEDDLGQALAIGLDEFIPLDDIPNIDRETMTALVSHLDIATKPYQSDRDDLAADNEDEDEDEDEDEND